jgi:hypothetical protein
MYLLEIRQVPKTNKYGTGTEADYKAVNPYVGYRYEEIGACDGYSDMQK